MLSVNDLNLMILNADSKIEEDPHLYEKMVFEELNQLSLQEDNFKDNINKLGASEIGSSCERSLYYSFHKYPKKQISARMIRLFNRGKLEEARIFAYLKLMGLEPYATDENYCQFSFSDFDGKFQGHCDGKIKLADGTFILLEMKTMNNKAYEQITKTGLYLSKPQYYTQIQIYMGYLNLPQALFVSVNKDTDDIYFQLVSFDKNFYERTTEKAKRIIECEDINSLQRESNFSSYYKCKWCNYIDVCFNK